MTPDPNNPWFLIPATLATNPDAVAALPVFAPHDPASTLVLASKTKVRRLPPDLAARIAQHHAESQGNGTKVELPTHMEVGRLLLTIPADIALNLRGPVAERHPVYLVVVRRDAYDATVAQTESRIVLPGQVQFRDQPIPPFVSGLSIVKP